MMLYLLTPLFAIVFFKRVKGLYLAYTNNHRDSLKVEIVMFSLLCIVGYLLFNFIIATNI